MPNFCLVMLWQQLPKIYSRLICFWKKHLTLFFFWPTSIIFWLKGTILHGVSLRVQLDCLNQHFSLIEKLQLQRQKPVLAAHAAENSQVSISISIATAQSHKKKRYMIKELTGRLWTVKNIQHLLQLAVCEKRKRKS